MSEINIDASLVNQQVSLNRAEEKLLNNLIARLETVPYKDRSYA